MRRRNFLQLIGLGSLAVALPSIAAYSSSVEDATAGIILEQFKYLKLDKQGVQKFVEDYYKLTGENKYTVLQLKTKAYYFLKVHSEKSQLVRNITTLYLLSTDFFMNRMDESREVKYVGIYNPHKTPCANPFSAIYYPPVVS